MINSQESLKEKMTDNNGKDRDNSKDRPECFKNLDKVFPMTDSGLRQTPEECFYHCPCKTECLRGALASSKGETVEEEIIDRRAESGAIGFFERWSRRKRLHNKSKKK